ncbi:hypothetical protein [Nannocystis pusilla]|uniref:hypothetical protein n=1 Tax=Nannocystis pusilla TaxID=889268 RepID=UPI003B774AA5
MIKRITRRMDKLLERDKGPDGQEAALALGVEFADIRAEAILLRRAGWDAMPLLLRRPALATSTTTSGPRWRSADASVATSPRSPPTTSTRPPSSGPNCTPR